MYTVTFIVVMLSMGCSDDQASPSAAAKSAPTTATSASGAPAASEKRPKIVGMLTESEFKALHELKKEEAPPPRGEMIDLRGSRAYLALPKQAKPPLPAVVVIHEWWGLNGHIKHWADRLAEDGYAALAIDLYGGVVATKGDKATELMNGVDDEAARKILIEGFELLGADPRIKAHKRASIGWCFGGKWSLELALAAPTLTAAVLYYGKVETSPERLASLEPPLLAIFGKRDKAINPKYVERFAFGIEQAGRDKRARIISYDADHAFANPSSARYDFKAAGAAWAEVRGFLGKHLKGPG